MDNEEKTKPSHAEIYRKWVAQLPAIREKFMGALADHPINMVNVRVDNFLGQLAHELKEAAVNETFHEPAKAEG